MKIKCLNNELNGSNATIVMESGDHVSIAFTDLNGDSRIITVSVQGKVLVVNEPKMDASLLVRANSNYYDFGDSFKC